MTDQLSFWTFLRKFWPNVGARMSGAASVPLTFFATYFPHAPLKILFACLAAFSVARACFLVWRDSMSELQATITARDAEIAKLKHRDYDDEHFRLAERKFNALTDPGKDLVHFLLHRGETEGSELEKRCQQPAYYNEAVQRARIEGLVVFAERPKVGRSGVYYVWSINPEFKAVLQDLVGKREVRHFL